MRNSNQNVLFLKECQHQGTTGNECDSNYGEKSQEQHKKNSNQALFKYLTAFFHMYSHIEGFNYTAYSDS